VTKHVFKLPKDKKVSVERLCSGLQREHRKYGSSTNFLLLGCFGLLADPDPDPQTRLNPDTIRIRICNTKVKDKMIFGS
jgi:hypothetical protein